MNSEIIISAINNSRIGLSQYYESIMDEAVLAYYLVFTRKRKHPEYIIPVYYPLKLVRIYDEYSLVIDPYGREEALFTHKCTPLNKVYDEINKILSERGEDLADKLSRIINVLKKYDKQVETYAYRLKGIIIDTGILDEIKELLTTSATHGEPVDGLLYHDDEKLNDDEIEKTKTIIVNLANHIEKELDILSEIKQRLNEVYDEWRDHIDKEFERKFGEVEKSIEDTRIAITKKIEALESRMSTEIKIVEEKYRALRTTYLNRKMKLEDEVRELEIRLENTNNPKAKIKYTEIIKKMKNEISNIDKKLSKLESERVKEINRIQNRYDQLIVSEKKRLKHIEDEKKKLRRIHNSWLNQVYEYMGRINKLIGRIEKRLVNEKNNIEKILVLNPHPLIDTVYLRTYIVGVGNRKEVVYPSRIELGFKKDEYVVKTYSNIAKKLLRRKIERLAKDLGERLIEKYNLLKNHNLDDVKTRLKKLSLMDEFLKKINIYLLDTGSPEKDKG